LQEIERLLRYQFRNPDLLACALTHRSLQGERLAAEETPIHNEKMEFLGDAILGFLVSQLLYEIYPIAREGDLSTLKGYLVSRKVLARIAKGMRLGDFLRLGKGEEMSTGRKKQSILADALEALVAALYLDGGWSPVHQILLPYLQEELRHIPHDSILDSKSRLQALVQLHFHILPRYRVKAQEGPSHDPHFWVEVKAGQKVLGTGKGKNKKEAEQEAAKDGLCHWQRNHQE